jgi:hypothetical protein
MGAWEEKSGLWPMFREKPLVWEVGMIYIYGILAISALYTHFSLMKTKGYRPNDRLPSWFLAGRTIFYIVLVGSAVGIFRDTLRDEHHIGFFEFIIVDFVLSTLVFLLISEILVDELTQFLTRSRGESWTKELDYLYLSLAVIGVVLEIGKSSLVEDPIHIPDAVGPIAVSMALVLRTIKTRAEINGWNKDPAGLTTDHLAPTAG